MEGARSKARWTVSAILAGGLVGALTCAMFVATSTGERASAQDHTCECPDGEPSLVSAYWASPSVFLGILAHVEHDVETHERRYRFRVSRIFRGPEHQFLVVRTPDAPASCGVTFRRYMPYVVYADGEENGTLSAFTCTSRIRGGVARTEREVERLEALLSAHARHGARP